MPGFINRVDEILVAPPFELGEQAPYLPFKCNAFIIPARHDQLQQLVDQHLNVALPKGPVRYEVPQSVQRVLLSFFRYERADSETDPAKGWLGYSEVLIGFTVVRQKYQGADVETDQSAPVEPSELPPAEQVPELLTFLGVVYIDDLTGAGANPNPYTIPIVLGREVYGMPKNPGHIRYDPQMHDPMQPWLRLWDAPSGGGHLQLAEAIVIEPVMDFAQTARQRVATRTHVPGELPQGSWEPGEPPTRRVPPVSGATRPDETAQRLRPTETPTPATAQAATPPETRPASSPGRQAARPPMPPDRALRVSPALAAMLGVRPSELVIKSADGVVSDPHAVLVQYSQEGDFAVAYTNQLWGTKLVAVKEFPDPTVLPSGNDLGEAVYQVVVEAPLTENPDDPLKGPKWLYTDQWVSFPTVNRVDLMNAFGIDPTQPSHPRRVRVDTGQMFYMDGSLLFADPSQVRVWKPL